MAKLKVLESAEADLVGKEFDIEAEESWIGRGADAAVLIPDAAISRRHARIEQKPDGFFLVDNGSANGTFLNDHPVTRAALKEGDRVRIGRTLFAVEGLPDPDGTMILGTPQAPSPQTREPATVVNYEPVAEPIRKTASAPPMTRPAPPVPVPRPPRPVPVPPPPVARPVPSAVAPPPPPPPRPAPAPPAVRPAPIPAAVPAPHPAPAPVSRPIPPQSAAQMPVATLAGFWVRFAAYLVDSVILSVIFFPLFFVLGMLIQPSASGPGGVVTGAYLLFQLVFAAIGLGYILYFWSRSGATPGKKLLRLKIVRTDGVQPIGIGTAGMRVLGFFVSSLILCIGFLMIGFSSDKRGLHDLIAKTRVIRMG
jgi:uncharacterized RDD family membrane protein YckC